MPDEVQAFCNLASEVPGAVDLASIGSGMRHTAKADVRKPIAVVRGSTGAGVVMDGIIPRLVEFNLHPRSTLGTIM